MSVEDQENAPHSEQTVGRIAFLKANVMSYIAVVLSVLALFVSILEVTFLHDEVRAQAWPYLQIDNTFNAEGFSLYVENKGVGPAKMHYVDFTLDGKKITDLDKAIKDEIGEENAFSFDTYQIRSPAPGVMSSDEKIVIFSVPWQTNTRMLIQRWGNRVSLEACYCSVYDDCWLAALGQAEPREVESCDVE
jgi:hypothetical protein